MRLHEQLDRSASRQPDAAFAEHGRERLTYREATAATERLAGALVRAGLRTGDRVAVLAKNCLEMVLLYYAASRAGVVLVPLNYRLAAPEWEYVLSDARPRVLFAGAQYAGPLDALRGRLGFVERFVALHDRPAGWESIHDWARGEADPAPADFGDDADALQLYTSATTGRPKGAVLTHRSLTATAERVAAACRLQPGDRYLAVLPLFHVGVVPTTFAPIARGASLVLRADFDPGDVVRALSQERIAVTTLVPAMIQACLAGVPDVAERRYEALRLIYYGASPIAESTLRAAMRVFGCGFVQSYGLTESTQALTFLTTDDHHRALGPRPELLLSAGRAVPETELRIVDSHDQPVPNGVPGEIVARGQQVMRCYWNRPDETAETLRGGWLHTGDVGRMDEDGYLYVLDRLKDMIVSGGENVYPGAVENVLHQHPAVADAAVIGVPDRRWGETVKAIVVPKPGSSATEADLVAFCRQHLGGFQVPRSVEFVDALPRNATGKVLKRVLREQYWVGHERRVAGA